MPIEVVDLLLSYLDWDTLERAALVCVSWWNIISEKHFNPYLAAQHSGLTRPIATPLSNKSGKSV